MSMEVLDEYLGGLREQVELLAEDNVPRIDRLRQSILPGYILLASGVIHPGWPVSRSVEDTVARAYNIDEAHMIEGRHSIKPLLEVYDQGSGSSLFFNPKVARYIKNADLRGFDEVAQSVAFQEKSEADLERLASRAVSEVLSLRRNLGIKY